MYVVLGPSSGKDSFRKYIYMNENHDDAYVADNNSTDNTLWVIPKSTD